MDVTKQKQIHELFFFQIQKVWTMMQKKKMYKRGLTKIFLRCIKYLFQNNQLQQK